MSMKYDIHSKYNNGPRSELQWKILIHICKTKDADFKSICKETHRNRTTIIQSIGPMIRRGLIEKIKVDPLLVKSRVIYPNILEYLQIVDQFSSLLRNGKLCCASCINGTGPVDNRWSRQHQKGRQDRCNKKKHF